MKNTEKIDVEDLDNLVTERALVESKEWLTTKETAEFLGVTIQTIATWAKKGAIPMKKVVGKNYFSTAKLRALINNEGVKR